ncbi:hypothetical protein WA026_014277 [Henosepilachna vigintioctopunctata]|uniref:Reverse transcriptase domain-containing protein n=1 Tax=Henosepilachna vigintioctopunctata TaxID=420089 RepID=A0AAW1TUK7_9CUCU
MPLWRLLKKNNNAMDNGIPALCVLMDLGKTFDTVDHNLEIALQISIQNKHINPKEIGKQAYAQVLKINALIMKSKENIREVNKIKKDLRQKVNPEEIETTVTMGRKPKNGLKNEE